MWPINPDRHRHHFPANDSPEKKDMTTPRPFSGHPLSRTPPPRRFRTIIGSNHGKAHSRIWLEGERLTEAGFTVGKFYRRVEANGMIYLHLVPDGTPGGVDRFYKVSGKGTKPIIDITGSIVARVFPQPLTHVHATFERGLIRISV